MRQINRYSGFALLVFCLLFVFLVFFLYHPEAQLAFLGPGLIIIAYSLIRDEYYSKGSMRWFKER